MRNLFGLFALVGIAGMVLGALTLLRAAPGPYGRLPFGFENYGGPGSIIGGLILLAVSSYLWAAWPSGE